MAKRHVWDLAGFCGRCGTDKFAGEQVSEWCTGESALDHVRNAQQLLLSDPVFTPRDTAHVDVTLDYPAYKAALERLRKAAVLLDQQRNGRPPRIPVAAALVLDERAELERYPFPPRRRGRRSTDPQGVASPVARILFGNPLLTMAVPTVFGMLSLD